MVKRDHWHIDPEPQKAIGCPFGKCALNPPKLGLISADGWWWVYCKNCAASGPNAHNEIEAVQMWNERHQETYHDPKKSGTVARMLGWILLFVLSQGRMH